MGRFEGVRLMSLYLSVGVKCVCMKGSLVLFLVLDWTQ